MNAQGTVFQYGDNVDTDVIIPARYLNSSDPAHLASHCMEDIDADFAKNVRRGDVVVGGENFGCGSSREHAPIALKASGVSCVIARSFARIFFRNAINIGLPILECPEAVEGLKAGDAVAVADVMLLLGNEYQPMPSSRAVHQELFTLGEGVYSVLAQRRNGTTKEQRRVIVFRNFSKWKDAGPAALYAHYDETVAKNRRL